jgi:hypothetical protein
MKFKAWSLWLCGALLAVEALILSLDLMALSVLPKGGTITPITYVYALIPLALIAGVLAAGRR